MDKIKLTELNAKFENIQWTNSKCSNFNQCVQELELIVNSSKNKNNLYKGHASTMGGQIFFDNDLNLINYLEGSDYRCISVQDHKEIFNHYGVNLVKIPIPEAFKDRPNVDYMQQYVKLVQ